MAAIPVSAYLICRDNAATIERALQSLRFADEIVVVDSGSRDQTLELARRYTDRIIVRDWPGFRAQYDFAAEQCRHEWRFFLDADEEVSAELAAAIPPALAANAARPPEQQVHGFDVHRRTWFFGRWIRYGGWVPDFEIRLHRAGHHRREGATHTRVRVDGPPAEVLPGLVYHYTYRDYSDFLRRIDRYSTLVAEEEAAAGKRFRPVRLLVSPPWRFFRDYVLKQGFRDGFPGLVIAGTSAFYVFCKATKLWERQTVGAPDRATAGG